MLKFGYIFFVFLGLYGLWESKLLITIIAIAAIGIDVVVGWVLPGWVD